MPMMANSEISDPYQDTDWLESPLHKTLRSLNGQKADFLVDGIYDCDDWAVWYLTDYYMMKGGNMSDLFVVCVMSEEVGASHALAGVRFYYEGKSYYIIMDPQSAMYLICTDEASAKVAAKALTIGVYGGEASDYKAELNRFAPYYKLTFHYNRYKDELEE